MGLPGGRTWGWIFGIVGLLAIVVGLTFAPQGEVPRTVVGIGIALGWASVYLMIELIGWARTGTRNLEDRVSAYRNAVAADGVVGLAPLPGIRSEIDPGAEPYRRFVGFEPDGGNWQVDPPACRADFPPLLGRVVAVNLFLGRGGRDWSIEEIGRAHRALRRAGEWIEREARRWSAAVNVDLCEVYFSVRDGRPMEEAPIPLEADAETYGRFVEAERTDALARFSRAGRELGLADAVALTREVGARIRADHVVWLLHPRSAGRSIAIPGDLTELPGVTLAICYAREEEDHEHLLAGEPFSDPITFVHELLHLFGAEDKYDAPLSSFPRRSVSERDVMRLDLDSLSRLRIDPLTASEIGWARPDAVLPPDPSRSGSM